MQMKISGMLMASSMFLLLIIVILFGGQLLFYQLHIKTYQEEINYNQARILRNIAQSNHLKERQTLYTNVGKVCYFQHRYRIELKNGNRFDFASYE